MRFSHSMRLLGEFAILSFLVSGLVAADICDESSELSGKVLEKHEGKLETELSDWLACGNGDEHLEFKYEDQPDGSITYFAGRVQADGTTEWKEIDEIPSGSDCDDSIAWKNRRDDLEAALRALHAVRTEYVPSLPCGVYLSYVACEISWDRGGGRKREWCFVETGSLPDFSYTDEIRKQLEKSGRLLNERLARIQEQRDKKSSSDSNDANNIFDSVNQVPNGARREMGPDETEVLFIDSDQDGLEDTRVTIRDGKPIYESIEHSLASGESLGEQVKARIKEEKYTFDRVKRVWTDGFHEIPLPDAVLQNLTIEEMNSGLELEIDSDGEEYVFSLSPDEIRDAQDKGLGVHVTSDRVELRELLEDWISADMENKLGVKVRGARISAESSLESSQSNDISVSERINMALANEVEALELGDEGTRIFVGEQPPSWFDATILAIGQSAAGPGVPESAYDTDDIDDLLWRSMNSSIRPKFRKDDLARLRAANAWRGAVVDMGIGIVSMGLQVAENRNNSANRVIMRTRSEDQSTYRVFERYRQIGGEWSEWIYVEETRALLMLWGMTQP